MSIQNISKVAVDSKQYSQSNITLSVEQQEVFENVAEELRHGSKPYVYVVGHAGSGKTLLATLLGREIPNTQFTAFTGKACSVLRQRGATNALTLHSLLYGAPSVLTHKHGQSLRWKRREEKINADLIIADECSMIYEKLAQDLTATGVKVLVTGDEMQLPPVKGQPYFTKPDYLLTEIHRQAAGSQPLRLATAIREGRRVKPQRYDIDKIMAADVVIVAFEKTRNTSNQIIRRAKGIRGNDPVVGDRVCCFRNNRDSGVLNGTLWSVQSVDEFREKIAGKVLDLFRLQLVDDIGNTTTVSVDGDYFYDADPRGVPFNNDGLDIFSYGFCLTCHKAQGSEWDRVVVIDETRDYRFPFIIGNLSLAEYRQRWLYTAVTRAKVRVDLMEPPP